MALVRQKIAIFSKVCEIYHLASIRRFLHKNEDSEETIHLVKESEGIFFTSSLNKWRQNKQNSTLVKEVKEFNDLE